MRVITGLARGTRLRTLEGDSVRPTSEKVKEAVFSMLHFDIEGRRILDLFAGCGQLGIEALSRGAKSAVFVDASLSASRVISENLKAAQLSESAEIVRKDFKLFLSTTSETFDIAFLDPPYHAGFYEDALELLCKRMSSFGVIVCEHPSDVAVPSQVGDFEAKKTYKYGKILVTVYRRKEETE